MLANCLSGLRILLIPLLFYFISQGDTARWQIVLLLLFAAATDLGDGLVARRFGQISRLGKIFDPLADKLFLACLLAALALWQGLTLWLLAMLLCRDLVIVFVGIKLFRSRGMVVPANRWGKNTTACMGFMALSHILEAPFVLREGLIGLAAIWCTRLQRQLRATDPQALGSYRAINAILNRLNAKKNGILRAYRFFFMPFHKTHLRYFRSSSLSCAYALYCLSTPKFSK